MSSVLRGSACKGCGGHRLQAQRRDADGTPAARDTRILVLNWVLDVELLSELADGLVHITRTRSRTRLTTGWATLKGHIHRTWELIA
ncbi:MAG: hypothetical protein JWN19_3458 [Arthrobacter sp.]|nr:hypothetical protein [Arthrobacter sp.]